MGLCLGTPLQFPSRRRRDPAAAVRSSVSAVIAFASEWFTGAIGCAHGRVQCGYESIGKLAQAGECERLLGRDRVYGTPRIEHNRKYKPLFS